MSPQTGSEERRTTGPGALLALSLILSGAAAAAVVIVMGPAIMTGRLSDFSFRLLDRFPVFSTIG